MNAFAKSPSFKKSPPAPLGVPAFGVWGSRVCRLLLAGLFLYSGGLKLWDLPAFWNAIQSYLFLPQDLMLLALYTVPVAEVVLGFAMLTPLYATASRMIFGLMIIFMVVLELAAAHGIDVTCGCFGGGDETMRNMYLLILRDAVLASIAYLLPVRKKIPPQK